ncbi:MAG: NADPH:quinone oxidoreductase family protein [Pseudomonadota bacterium]
MKAYTLRRIDSQPELGSAARPEPGPGEVQIEIEACALNFADLLMIRGRYQDIPQLPAVLGMEFAGHVSALGPDTPGPAPGTRVAAVAGHGGLAEFAVVPASRCVPVPDAMPLDEAAAFQIAYGTSHVALRHRANLQPGETVLVLGAAGGVGLTAVELAHRMGARVIACARGPEKLAVAKAAGADEVVDSDRDDLREVFKGFGGVDVVYDALGEPHFTPALRACRPEARYLVIGFAGGTVPQIPANILLVKNIDVMGLYWGGYLKFAPEVLTESLAELFSWYEDGKLTPHISHRLPLSRVAEGLEILKERRSTGKIVIQPKAR